MAQKAIYVFGTSKQTLSNRIESTGNFSSIEEFAQGSFNPSSFIKSTPKLGKDFSQAENERQDKRTQHNPHIQESSCWELCGRKLHHNWETPCTSNELPGLKAMDVRRSKEWISGPTPLLACLPVGTKKAAGIFWRAHSVGNLFYGFLARSFRKGFLLSASFQHVEEN